MSDYPGQGMSREQVAKQLLCRINQAMLSVERPDGRRVTWFYCFGNILEYCDPRRGDFSIDYDIDIGLLYEECDYETLARAFEAIGYKRGFKIVNDVDGKVLNAHFKPDKATYPHECTPSIDFYWWYPHKGIRYHTYDCLRERKEVPSKYIFRGVKEWMLVAPEKEVKRVWERKRTANVEIERILPINGVWKNFAFNDPEYVMHVPYAYGTLLDIWYCDWRFPAKTHQQSDSPWQKEMKSCKEWKKI